MIKNVLLLMLVFTGSLMLGQEGPPPGGPGGSPPGAPMGMRTRVIMGPGGMPLMAWWTEPRIVQEVGISQPQVQQIQAIFDQAQPQLTQQAEALRTQEQQLRSLLDAYQPDTGAVNTLIDQIAQGRAGLEKTTARMQFAIRALLTQDQWSKLQDEAKAMQQRMRERMQRRRGPEGPPPPQPEPPQF